MRPLAAVLVGSLLGLQLGIAASAEQTANDLIATDATTDSDGRALRVANNGIDTPDCGLSHPCRSIGQAITNADEGDTILVGPGRYGDLNANGIFGDPGEERLDSEGCLVCITKSLVVVSTQGAASTIIDAAGNLTAGLLNAVSVSADGAIFGRRDRGFTITNSPENGFRVASARRVRIEGNVALGNGASGFFFEPGEGLIRVSRNISVDNDTGFSVFGPNMAGASGRVELFRNVASRNTTSGFFFAAVEGITVTHRVLQNIASQNGVFGNFTGNGITIGASGLLIEDNTITGNVIGVLVGEGASRLLGNTIAGNLVFEVQLSAGADAGNRLNENNLFGGPFSGCVIDNQSEERVDARNNYWGTPSGPTPPIEFVCTAPDLVRIEPIAKNAFPTKP